MPHDADHSPLRQTPLLLPAILSHIVTGRPVTYITFYVCRVTFLWFWLSTFTGRASKDSEFEIIYQIYG